MLMYKPSLFYQPDLPCADVLYADNIWYADEYGVTVLKDLCWLPESAHHFRSLSCRLFAVKLEILYTLLYIVWENNCVLVYEFL